MCPPTLNLRPSPEPLDIVHLESVEVQGIYTVASASATGSGPLGVYIYTVDYTSTVYSSSILIYSIPSLD